MPKFKVSMTATEVYVTTIEVEAADRIEAEEVAFGVYETMPFGAKSNWKYEDGKVEINVQGEIIWPI